MVVRPARYYSALHQDPLTAPSMQLSARFDGRDNWLAEGKQREMLLKAGYS
jgi:hypothetical protein